MSFYKGVFNIHQVIHIFCNILIVHLNFHSGQDPGNYI